MRVLLCVFAALLTSPVVGEPLSAEQRAKVEAKLTILKVWGSAPEIVGAVQAAPVAWAATMDQTKWTALSVLSPEVKALSKNDAAVWVRGQKDPAVSEAFVSRADGTKVAFLGKPTSWSHKGKPKHDVPMTGKTWIGDIETDESTGVKQVQVSFPVLAGSKVVGSMVVGLQISKL